MCVLLKPKVFQVLPEHVFATMSALLHVDHASALLQEVELWEACRYGLVGQVHNLLTTGVNVNVTDFVSDKHDINFDSRFSVLSQFYQGWRKLNNYGEAIVSAH